MFVKIIFNAAEPSTWPKYLINGVDTGAAPNLTNHAEHGAGLTWVGINGRDVSLYGNGVILYLNDEGAEVNAEFVSAVDSEKIWAAGQISNFTFINSKGGTSNAAFSWSTEEEEVEAPVGDTVPEVTLDDVSENESVTRSSVASDILAAQIKAKTAEVDAKYTTLTQINWDFQTGDFSEEFKATLNEKQIEEGNTIFADWQRLSTELVDLKNQLSKLNGLGEQTPVNDDFLSKEEPIGELPIRGDEGGLIKEPGFTGKKITTASEMAQFLTAFNSEIIAYNEALNEVESILIDSKESFKKARNLDTEFVNRKTNIDNVVAGMNTRQAEKIAALEVELDEEEAKANTIQESMQIKVTEVNSRNTAIDTNPIMGKLATKVNMTSLDTRRVALKETMETVTNSIERNVKVESQKEIEAAKLVVSLTDERIKSPLQGNLATELIIDGEKQAADPTTGFVTIQAEKTDGEG